jgi:hypothetical protein
MEKTTTAYVNPFEDVHKKSRVARELLQQTRENDLLIREKREAAEAEFREKHQPGAPETSVS